jgi:hypothetical protein
VEEEREMREREVERKCRRTKLEDVEGSPSVELRDLKLQSKV